MANLAKRDGGAVEQLLGHGDLEAFTPEQRNQYYLQVCESLGLNPLTRPFEYLRLNGKLILYARRDATEQLRKRDQVSIRITAREAVEGLYIVTAQATLPDGRTDESVGAVPLENLKGETRANAILKAETKAKRRVTLSICGLGMLDESEVASVEGAVREEPSGPQLVKATHPGPSAEDRIVEEYRAKMAAVGTEKELKAVGVEISRAKLSDAARLALSVDYKRELQAVRAGAA